MDNRKYSAETSSKLISIYKLVDEVVSHYKRINRDHRKFFINDVPRNLSITAGDNKAVTQLDKFIAAISANPAKACIRISADASNNNVKLYLKSTQIQG